MAIYKRPNSKYYWMKFWHNGALVQRSTKMTSKKEADGYEKRIWVKLQNGELTIADLDKSECKNISTFAEAVESHLEYCKLIHANKPRTYEHKTFLAKPLLDFFGKRKINQITKKHIEDYLIYRGSQTSKKTKENISRDTINNELIFLKGVFDRLSENGTIKNNPAVQVGLLPPNEQVFHIITSDEETFYLMSATQPLKDIFTLMINGGFRPDEIYNLKRSQVNLEQNFVQITNGKSKASNRKVYLMEKAKMILAERMSRFAGVYLFPINETDNKPPVTSNFVNKQHLANVRALKLDFRLYDARHTFATRLHENGTDLLTLAYILGHSDLSTLKRYAHPSEQLKVDAVKNSEVKCSVAKM